MTIPLKEIILNCLVATTKILLLCFGGAYLAKIQVIRLSLQVFSDKGPDSSRSPKIIKTSSRLFHSCLDIF